MHHFPIVFHNNVKKTFLYSIKINLQDIKRLRKESREYFEKYRQFNEETFLFYARAKHIEMMELISITAEYLLKAILLNNGFVINKIKDSPTIRYSEEFLRKVEEFNKKNLLSQKDMNELYFMARKDIDLEISEETLSFKKCIDIFNKYIKDKYIFPKDKLKIQNKNTGQFYGNELSFDNCFEKIRKSRNSYVHLAEALYESKGISKFFYRFLVTLSKLEFGKFFEELGEELDDDPEN